LAGSGQADVAETSLEFASSGFSSDQGTHWCWARLGEANPARTRRAISAFDPDDTEQADLRGGRSPWLRGAQRPVSLGIRESLKCGALIVGAGITGSLIAERLTRQGLDVVVIDRELPGRGSTIASTAMLLWEIDRSLSQLTGAYGFERASRAYRASLDAVIGLKSLVRQLGLSCELRDKNSLYLAAGDTAKDLFDEHQLRARAGLPGDFLSHQMLLESYGIARAGGGRRRSRAIIPRPAQSGGRAWRKAIRGRGRRIRRGITRGLRSIGWRLPDRSALRDPCDRLCHALDRPYQHADDLVQLGHCNQAAATKPLERRRADLGRQQGLSVCENDIGWADHHRRGG
jgi:hypothetical protein